MREITVIDHTLRKWPSKFQKFKLTIAKLLFLSRSDLYYFVIAEETAHRSSCVSWFILRAKGMRFDQDLPQQNGIGGAITLMKELTHNSKRTLGE